MRRTLELAETCIEGLRYISKRLDKGLMEDSLFLLEDIVCGFCQISESIQVLESFIHVNELLDVVIKVEVALHDVLSAYEHRDINFASYSLNNLLLPAFQSWGNGLTRVLQPHIFS